MSRLPHPVFGWNAVKLYQNLTLEQLGELREAICRDPKNFNSEKNSIYIYSKSARRKLDALSWAVSYHLKDSKLLTGGNA